MSEANNTPFTIAFIDIECTCNSPIQLPREEVETIEIGACVAQCSDEELTVVSRFQIFIKPKIHEILSEFCIELTGISQSDVDAGDSLSVAMKEVDELMSDKEVVAWSSWGKFDLTQLNQEAKRDGVESSFMKLPHVNLKQLFARRRKHRVGLAKALEISHLNFEGRPHSGSDDALNVARLVAHDKLLAKALIEKANNLT